MKKVFFLFFVALFSVNLFSQEERAMSNADVFLSQKGLLFEKTFIEVGKFYKINISNIIVKSIGSEKILKYVRFSYNTVSKYSNKKTFYASIDEDEIDDLLKVIDFMTSKFNGQFPEKYTELNYKSRSGFSLFSYTKSRTNDWQCGMQLDEYDNMSSFFFSSQELKDFKLIIEKAASLL